MADNETKAEETKQAFDLSTLTKEQIKELSEKNDAFKEYVNQQKDQHFSKSIETWKANNLQKLVDEELNKRNPKETAEQKAFRELQEEVKELKLAKTTAENRADAVRSFNAEGLPEDLLDVLDYTDAEKMQAQIERIKTAYKDILSRQVEEQVAKKTGRKPAEPDSKIDNPLGYNPFDKDRWNLTDQLKLDSEYPELAKALEKAAKK